VSARALPPLRAFAASFRDDPVAQKAMSHALTVLPALFVGAILVVAVLSGTVAVDGANNYLPAAHALMHGRSPYSVADIPGGTVFASPPLAALIFVPLLVLPLKLAEFVMSFAMLACVLGAVRLLGVRDWRCYAATCLWLPTLFEFQTANLSGLLVLATAAVWRFRDRSPVAAVAAGSLVALKLYGWPVIVFLLVSRRIRATVGAVVVVVVAALLPWAAFAFRGLGGFPHLLNAVTHAEAREGYWIANLFSPVMSWSVAQGLAYAVGLMLLVASARVRDEQRKFVLCLGATLALTPIAWMHYFVVLAVVLAIRVPRFSAIWLLPTVLWLAPDSQQHPHGNPLNVLAAWQVTLVCLTVGAVFFHALRNDASAQLSFPTARLTRAPGPSQA
jgi:alpha-1,2-mannosyltransferase